MDARIIVNKVNIIGWGGGPAMTYGVSYIGEFTVTESIGGMLKFTALQDGKRECGDYSSVIKKGSSFYSAPNTIREMK